MGPKPAGSGLSPRDRMSARGSSTIGSSRVLCPLPTGLPSKPGPPNAFVQPMGIVVNGTGSVMALPSASSIHTRGPATRRIFENDPTAKRTGHTAIGAPPGVWHAARSSTSARSLKSAKSSG